MSKTKTSTTTVQCNQSHSGNSRFRGFRVAENNP